MIRFNGLPLFDSGPAVTRPGPIRARQAMGDTPGSLGGAVVHQGLHLREIVQIGQLTADTPAEMDALTGAITDHLDGRAATLNDENGRDWPGCVLSRFEPGQLVRLGPRFVLDYRLLYHQPQL